MYTDGLPHDIDFFINQFSPAEVTPETFDTEKQRGLYVYTGNLPIDSNTEQLEYFYYSDDEFTQTYDHETIPVVRDGISTASVIEYYARTSSPAETPVGWQTTPPEFTGANMYLWNYEVTILSDGTQITTEPVIISQNGKGIKEITEYYAVNNSATTSPTSWQTTPPSLDANNKYLWNYEKIIYTDNTEYVSNSAVIGTYGEQGPRGENGINASMYMGLRSSAPTSHPDGSPLVNGDTYLNTTDTKLYKYSSGTWNALDDNSAEWWSAMGDALNYVGQTGTQIQAANIWVNKLVAGTILADSIKTNILTADNIKAISGVFQDITVTGGFVVTKGIQGKYITPVEGVTFLNNVNNALKDYEKGVYNANGIIYMKAGNPFDEEDDYNLTVVINSIEKSTLFNDTFIRGYWYDNTGKIRGEVSINTRTGSVTHPWDWGPPPPSTIIKDVFNYKIII